MTAFEGDVAPGGWPGGNPNFAGRDRQRVAPNRLAERWDSDLWKQQMIDAGLVRQPSVMSRRSLLTGGAALAVGLAVDNIGKFSQLAKWLDDKVVGQFDYDEAVKEAKGFLKERYGINLVMGNEKDQDEFRGDPVALERYRVTLRLIVQEMSKYPPEMIHKIAEGRGLEIRVVDNLFVKEGQQESRREFRAGGLAPFLEQGKVAQLILDAGYAEHHQRAMVHHELNHRASQKWENQTERNKKWVGFHSKV